MCDRKSYVSEELLKIINNIAKVKNVTDIQFNCLSDSSDVDSFASGLHKVVIKGKRDGIGIKFKVIVKWHPKMTDRICFRDCYKREYMFVNKVAPIFLNLQQNYISNKGLKLKFPNCILSSIGYNKEVIVFHVIQNYKLLNRFYQMDFAHASLVIRSLAKLHALSFATEALFPEKFEEIKQLFRKDVQYSDLNIIPKSLEWYFNTSVSVISSSVIKSDLQRISNKISLILNRSTAPVSKYSVICHSDCWHNNIFFLHKGNRPVDLVFVDFQMARFASPVTDISYFLYMTSEYDFLVKHYDQLIYIYYATLSACLSECKVAVGEVYPKDVFQDHLQKYSILGLVEALISMKIITAEPEEAQKMTEVKHQVCNGLHQYETENQNLFVSRINGVVNFFFDRNYSIDHFNY